MVIIVHEVEISASRPYFPIVLVADFEVVQPLRLRADAVCLCHHVFKVVARGLFVGNGIRGVPCVLLAHLIGDAEFGVEEIIASVKFQRALLLAVIKLLRHPRHAVGQMAILQVEKAMQPLNDLIIDFPIEIEVCFLGIVVVIEVVWIDAATEIAHPQHSAKVVAVVFVPSASQICRQHLVVVIQRGNHAVKVVLHLFLTYQVAFFAKFRAQKIFVELLRSLVLLVVAVAMRIMQRRVKVPLTT